MRPTRLLATLAVLTFLALPASPVADRVDAGGGGIQPGDIVTVGSSQCTLNFVYDGVGALAGRVFIGTAAHCVGGVGDSASTTSWSNFGTVAFVGDAGDVTRDYAFIEIRSDLHVLANPNVRGHPGFPNGYTTTSDTATGDLVLLSGYGLGFAFTQVTREERVGVMYGDNPETYVIDAPIIFGDSGGPLLHDSGKALGVVSQIVVGCCAGPVVWNDGPTIERVLGDAAANGFPVALRTAS